MHLGGFSILPRQVGILKNGDEPTAYHTSSALCVLSPREPPVSASFFRPVPQPVALAWPAASSQCPCGAFVLSTMSSGITCRAERQTIFAPVCAPPTVRSVYVPIALLWRYLVARLLSLSFSCHRWTHDLGVAVWLYLPRMMIAGV